MSRKVQTLHEEFFVCIKFLSNSRIKDIKEEVDFKKCSLSGSFFVSDGLSASLLKRGF